MPRPAVPGRTRHSAPDPAFTAQRTRTATVRLVPAAFRSEAAATTRNR